MLIQQLLTQYLPESGIGADDVDTTATSQYAQKISNAIKSAFHVPVNSRNDRGFIVLTINNGSLAPEEQGNNPSVITAKNLSKVLDPFVQEFRKKGWTFTQPVRGSFSIGVPKQVNEHTVSENTEVRSFDQLLDDFMEENRMYSFEGRKGLEHLCHLVSALGYKDPNYQLQLSSKASVGDLINFLEDNPGVFEVILDFIKNHDSQEWAENLKYHLGE